VNHLKGYPDLDAAMRSKAAGFPGAVIDDQCPCKLVHVRLPKEPKVKVPAQRAKPGALTAAVALVLAGESTVAEAARQFGCDPAKVDDLAWVEVRSAVFEFWSWTCLNCAELAQDVHHRLPKGAGGTSDPLIAFGRANTCPLCRRCHDLAHKLDPDLIDRGFLLTTDQDPAEVPVYVRSEWGYERYWLLPNGETSRTSPKGLAA
jgi:hypothetical protein